MTATITTINGKTIFINEIVKMDRIGTHTYEFTQFINREASRIRVVEVAHIIMSDMCKCHNDFTDHEKWEDYHNTTT